MCGIVGFVGNEHAAPILLDGLARLEYRGYDSAGIAVIDSGKIDVLKTVGRIKSLYDLTESKGNVVGNIGIGHTRWATHGAPSEANSHPHCDQNKKFAVVHNGIIENYLSIKNELISEGFVFTSETDTEVVAHLLAKHYNGDMIATLSKIQSILEGSYALGILCTDFPDKFFAMKKANPLIIGLGKMGNFIASDITALVSYTRNVIYLDDGDIAEITENEAKLYNTDGSSINKEVSKITWSVSAAEKGGYDHFMMKEIMEQPEVMKKTAEPRLRDGKVVFDELLFTAEDLKKFNRILITGCGSAYHAGMVGKTFIEELTRIPVEVDLASEFRYRNPIINDKTLVIVISQSGETADTIAAMNEAKRRGATVLAIVNVVGSTIAKGADAPMYTWAGPEIAVATTKAYSTQVLMLYLFGLYVAQMLGTYDEKRLSEIVEGIHKLPEKIQKILDKKDDIYALAKRTLCGNRSMFFIGRNLDYAVALEGSLKLKEISYIHSEAYAAGELKHGTISLIDEGRLVVALAAYEALFGKLLSNLEEVKARGAKVIATAMEGNTEIEEKADEVIFIPKTDPLLLASVEIVPLQLFAYYVALLNGCDIDKPRNLAKSVTVE